MKITKMDEGGATLEVSREELVALSNALNETLNAIEEWEFSSRVGVEVSEAEALHKVLGAAISPECS